MSVTLLNKLGSGKFGNVYRAKNEDGDTFAVKIIEPRDLRYIELDILTRLKSPYLIRSYHNPIIDTKLGEGLSLEIKENNLYNLSVEKLSYRQLKRIFISCLYGLKCLHDNNYLHLDIKITNIMYDISKSGDFTAFIGDFGYAVRCNDSREGITASQRVFSIFMAPENIMRMDDKAPREYFYNDKTDMWSLGIVFLYLLGARIKLINHKTLLNDLKGITEEYIEEKIRMYNKNKMSSNEELEIKEMLVNMLKFNNKDRMSSLDVDKLSIVKNNNLRDSCILEKPKEIYYLPYISPQVKDGIEMIEDFYQKSKNNTIAEYFLSIQLFIRLMAKSKPDLDRYELKKMVENSIGAAHNYYHLINNGNYDLAKKLNGELGYNPYFYKAKSIDDLVILNYHLKDNDNLISFYNIIDPSELFAIFRKKFEYTNMSKNKISLEDFFLLTVPRKKEEDVAVHNPDDYYNNLNDMKERISNITKVKEIEKDFRTMIIENIKENINKLDPDDERIDMVYNIIQGNVKSTIYHNLKNVLGDINISEKFISLVDYGYIKLDENNNISKLYKSEKEYVIIVSGNKSSLLRIEERKVTHYYSDAIDTIKKYYQEKGYNYENNYDYGISNCCVLKEACIIFNIYYNNRENEQDFYTKCLERHTFFLIIVYLIIH